MSYTVEKPLIQHPKPPVSDDEARRDESTLRYLSPNEYPLWDSLVEASAQGSVFCRTWWLKAVGGDVRVLGLFEKGRLVAGMPLYFEKRLGMTMCRMPKLTHTWGLVIEPLSGKRVNIASREMTVMGRFAEQLAKHKIFYQVFHPNLPNWLPFYWNGFKQTSRVTYVIDDLNSMDRIWGEMSTSTRNKIRKAQMTGLEVLPCCSELVFDMVVKTFARQQKRVPFTLDFLIRLHSAAAINGAGECFAAKDQDGRVHGACFLVWDKKRLYNLAAGADPGLRASGAQLLLLWHAIQFSAQHAAVFDFEGSVLKGVENVFREFGARQVPINWITKLPFWLETYLSLQGNL